MRNPEIAGCTCYLKVCRNSQKDWKAASWEWVWAVGRDMAANCCCWNSFLEWLFFAYKHVISLIKIKMEEMFKKQTRDLQMCFPRQQTYTSPTWKGSSTSSWEHVDEEIIPWFSSWFWTPCSKIQHTASSSGPLISEISHGLVRCQARSLTIRCW